MEQKQIFVAALEDCITLYWEKPEKVTPDMEYVVSVNGVKAGSTKKTHYTIRELMPETDYVLQVAVKYGKMPETAESFLVTTGKRKLRLDVTKAPYHASGDGITMNTQALQQAIDACQPNQAVYLPAGVYLTGALRLHSNMELYLDDGAILQGTDMPEDYLPRIKSRFEGIENESYSSLLNLGELDHNGEYNCQNVVIRGEGVIASGGRSLAERVIASERERLKDYLAMLGEKINECEKPETIPGRVRPRLINMSNCRNILLMGLHLKNGASWNVHMIYSDRIVTCGCSFFSENVWNGDGWDPDSSSNCTIFNCDFYTGDDSVAIKSGKNPEGNVIGRPAAHIRIFDCRASFGHGITIGSEMSGGVEDVKIWDCDMGNSVFGIEIKGTKKRGGYVRNVTVRDSRVCRILCHSVGYNDDGEGALVPPVFEELTFERVHILGEYLGYDRQWTPCDAIELCGFDEPGHEVRNVCFRDITIGGRPDSCRQKLAFGLCENLTLQNIRCV